MTVGSWSPPYEVDSISLLGHTQCGGHLEGGLHKATNSRESHITNKET